MVSTRERIAAAATRCFAERGVLATTIADVQAAAGVSAGSLYHHFADKQAIVEATYVRAVRAYQDAFVSELARHTDAEAGIRAIVAFHLRWCDRNRHEATLLLREDRPRAGSSASVELSEANRAFLERVLAWWRPHERHGVLQRLPVHLAYALWLGPSQELSRLWLAGAARRPTRSDREALAAAAWRSLRLPGKDEP